MLHTEGNDGKVKKKKNLNVIWENVQRTTFQCISLPSTWLSKTDETERQ